LGIGTLISFIIFYFSTLPFAKDNVFSFSKWLILKRILPTALVAHKASVSAFNFYTIFWRIDYDLEYLRIFGVPLNIYGILIFLVINLLVFSYVKKRKGELMSIIFGIYVIGLGSFLFLTNMLERYFFSGFIPMIIIIVTQPRLLIYGFLMNLVALANLIFSFFRRTVGVIADLFSANNFLFIKLLSLVNIINYFVILNRLKLFSPLVLKSKSGLYRFKPRAS